MAPPLTLSAAISAAQSAQSVLNSADGVKETAQTNFDSAQSALTDATTADSDAVSKFNLAMDALAQAATAAKR